MPHEKKDQSREPKLQPYSFYAAMVLMVAYVFNFLDRQLLAVLAENVKADLGVSDSEMGFLFGTAFATFYAVFGLPLARWADLGTRKHVIGFSVVFWSTMTMLSGFAGNFKQLAACRFGVGFGEAGASPASYSMLYDYFPKHLRATAIGIYSVGVYIGSGLGLFLGGAIVAWWMTKYPVASLAPMGLKGWQAAFLIVGFPGLLLGALILTLREPPREREAASGKRFAMHETGRVIVSLVPVLNWILFSSSRRGASLIVRNITAMAVIAATSALLVIISGDLAQWAALGLGAYAVFSWGQGATINDPEGFSAIFQCRPVVFSMASMAVLMFANYSFTFWAVPLFQRLFGESAQATGVSMGLANASGGILGIVVGGMLADRFVRRWPAGKSYVYLFSVICSGIAGIGLLTTADKTIYLTFYFLFTAATALGTAPMLSFISDQVPSRSRATVAAATLLGNNTLGFALAPYCIGKVSDALAAGGSSAGDALRTAMLMALFAIPLSAILIFQAARLVSRAAAAEATEIAAPGRA